MLQTEPTANVTIDVASHPLDLVPEGLVVPLLVVVLLTPFSENWFGVQRHLLGVALFLGAIAGHEIELFAHGGHDGARRDDAARRVKAAQHVLPLI